MCAHSTKISPAQELPNVSTAPTPKTQGTRRARRAAERKAASPAGGGGSPRAGRSPILLITALVGVLAVVLIGGLVLLQGSAPAKVDAAGLIAPTSSVPVELADGRSLGKADAPVTLDVWSDYQCPACGQFAKIVEPVLIAKYVTPGTLRIVHHDAAFQGARTKAPYDESVEAGVGARCAAEKNLYWQFHDWLFANQSGENKGAFADARLRAIATAVGLDVAAWDACRATGTQQTAVRSETQEGVSKGLSSTPTMYLNGETIVGVTSAAELGTKVEAAAAAK